jgi:hypothetical protein
VNLVFGPTVIKQAEAVCKFRINEIWPASNFIRKGIVFSSSDPVNSVIKLLSSDHGFKIYQKHINYMISEMIVFIVWEADLTWFSNLVLSAIFWDNVDKSNYR